MKRMEIGAWRLALGGARKLGWRTSERADAGVYIFLPCTFIYDSENEGGNEESTQKNNITKKVRKKNNITFDRRAPRLGAQHER